MSVGRELEDLRKRLDWMETQVAKLPSRLSQNVGGGGSGEGWRPQEYALETDLPTGDRLATDMAVLTDGDLAGSWWVPAPGLTGWRPLNVWRAP